MTTPPYAERLKKAKAAIAEAGLTALLVSPGPDLRYLIGYDARLPDRLTCLVVAADGDPIIVVPELEEEAAAAGPLGAAGVGLVIWEEGSDPYSLVAAMLPHAGEVAVNDTMWAVHAHSLRYAMPGLTQRSSGTVLSPLRKVKDEAELVHLRKAGAAIDSVHARMSEWLRPGRTEAAVGRDIRVAILEAGHDSADLVIVGSGPNGASPHHGLSDRVIEPGDAVVVDIGGAMPSGYWSDCTRTYAMGEPSSELAALYSVVRAAQETACEAVSAGVAAEAVDAAARRVIAEAGYSSPFVVRTGHGLGLQIHEEPFIKEGNEERLASGMVFSVEPGIYVPSSLGARLEDIIVCTKGGFERLNTGSHDLVVVDV